MAKKELKQIDVLSFSVMLGIIAAIYGIVEIIAVLVFGGLAWHVPIFFYAGAITAWDLRCLHCLLEVPAVYFAYAFILAAFFAIIYNLVARKWPIKVDLK